jgi:hypothetical protein
MTLSEGRMRYRRTLPQGTQHAAREAEAVVGDSADFDSDNSDDEDDLPWGDNAAVDGAFAADYIRLNEAARVPLFEGSSVSCLEAVAIIVNILRNRQATSLLTSEVFACLHRVILPQPKSLSDSEYEASALIKRLGLSFDNIHVCVNNCVLFRGPHQDLQLCPRCQEMRMQRHGESWVPRKVLRHFPLFPRLQQIFRSRLQAALMTWHTTAHSTDGKMHNPVDSPQWKFVNENFGNFGNDPRNLRLGLATDGINPFSEKRSTYSTWPVMLLNHNVPPWLTSKPYFIILSLIIPGKRSVTSKDFDTFIEPLVQELRLLWMEGIVTRDAAAWNSQPHFLLRVILIWCIHAYGMVAGCVTKGYRGCPVCGPHCKSRRSRVLRKNVWDAKARRYLHANHPWRTDSALFHGRVEARLPPPQITGNDILTWGREREEWLRDGGVMNSADDPIHLHGIKKVSILAALLSYWMVSNSTSAGSADISFSMRYVIVENLGRLY